MLRIDWKTGDSRTDIKVVRSALICWFDLKFSVVRTFCWTSLSSSRAARVSLDIGILIWCPIKEFKTEKMVYSFNVVSICITFIVYFDYRRKHNFITRVKYISLGLAQEAIYSNWQFYLSYFNSFLSFLFDLECFDWWCTMLRRNSPNFTQHKRTLQSAVFLHVSISICIICKINFPFPYKNYSCLNISFRLLSIID